MSLCEPITVPSGSTMLCHLLSAVDFRSTLALEQRLVYETAGRSDGAITLLACEHPPVVSVGRQGSRSDVRFDPVELRSQQLEVHWVNRGGGSLLHAPGQLAVYPVVPLAWHGWSVGSYLDRLEAALSGALAEAGFKTERLPGRRGLWGRSGQLVCIGAAVRSGVTYHGAYINVDPPMTLVRRIVTDHPSGEPMSCLAAERPQPVRMATVRQLVITHLATAFDVARHHVFTGHPLLARSGTGPRGVAARAG